MYGYHGGVLWVDLTSRTVRSEPLDAALLRQYLGGVGLGARLLYSYAPKGVEPLHPDNPLIFSGGPFAGAGLAGSSKFAVACKSPLTGFIGDSLSSGPLAEELHRVGERINNLRKMFNVREGWIMVDDTLPPRIFGEDVGDGEALAGHLSRDELKAMVDDYYRARGWTPEGLVPRDKLEELGLLGLVGTDIALAPLGKTDHG